MTNVEASKIRDAVRIASRLGVRGDARLEAVALPRRPTALVGTRSQSNMGDDPRDRRMAKSPRDARSAWTTNGPGHCISGSHCRLRGRSVLGLDARREHELGPQRPSGRRPCHFAPRASRGSPADRSRARASGADRAPVPRVRSRSPAPYPDLPRRTPRRIRTAGTRYPGFSHHVGSDRSLTNASPPIPRARESSASGLQGGAR